MSKQRPARTRVWLAAVLVFAFFASLLPTVLDDAGFARARGGNPSTQGSTGTAQSREARGDGTSGPTGPAEISPVQTAAEPSWADAHSPEVPPAFVGDFALRGVVVDSAGTPVSDAVVEARPGWMVTRMTPFSDAQASALETRSGSRGDFQFNALPRVHDYRITAVSNHSFGSSTVQRRGSADGEPIYVRVVLQPTWIEWVRFDNAGQEAVVPAGGGPRPLYGPVLFQSEFGPPSFQVARTLERLGIAHDVAEGEFLIVYSKLELSLPPGSDPKSFAENLRRGDFAQARAVRDPRWETIEYRSGPRRSGAADQPSIVTVTPRAAAGKREIYRVEFPDVVTPAPWGMCSREYGLRIAVGGLVDPVIVTPRQPTFVAPIDTRPELRLAGFPEELPFRRSARDGQIVITPSFPELGFITLHYESRTLASPTLLTLHSASDAPDITLSFADLFPGYARIGPLPVGQYRIRMQWASGALDGTGAAMHEDWHGPISLRAGYNVVHWR